MAHYIQDRIQKQFVDENNAHKVQPIDCVPVKRTNSGWTNGVKAWDKIDGADTVVGWFNPPRQRNKRIAHTKKKSSQTPMMRPHKGDRQKILNPKKEWRKEWADKVNRADMMNMRREGEKGLDVDSMFADSEEIISEEE
jgi:hypothetical protein